MQLNPLVAARMAHALLGLVAAGVGVGFWQDGFGPGQLAAAVAGLLFGLGARIAVRSFRMGVECRNGVVQVRGLLLTRRVPRASIEEVTGFPALRWRDDAGRHRWTPVVFLADSRRTLGYVRRHNTGELDRLRRWVITPPR